MLALSLLRLVTGLFAGKSLSVNMVGIPSIRGADNPIQTFKKLHQQAQRLGFAFMSCIVPLALWFWWQTNDHLALICAVCFICLMPHTLMYLVPAVHRLLSLNQERDKEQVRNEIEKWNRAHWVHTCVGIACYFVFEFCLSSKD